MDLEPVHEEIHREMMRIYLTNGQRALAVQQYETCRQILARELELAPMEETQALCQQARTGSANGQTPASICFDRIELQRALKQLGVATRNFDEAQSQLRQAEAKFEQAQQQLRRALHLVNRAKQH